MRSIVDKILAIAAALDERQLPYAFGGALALAFCTERARGTVDIDLNVFVGKSEAKGVLSGLDPLFTPADADLAALEGEGQARLWWDQTPVDLFLNTTEFHVQAAERLQLHDFGGRPVPFLSCSDLAVFKAFFNRARDWADLEEMIRIGTPNIDQTLGVLVRYLGEGDRRVQKLRALTAPNKD